MAGRVDIALGFDANYAPHAAAVIASVLRNAPGAQFRFIIVCEGVGDAMRAQFGRFAPDAEFVWCEIPAENFPQVAPKLHLSRATLFRTAVEYLAPQDCRRVLYLDSDVVVLGDIRELWASDLGDCSVGAIADFYQDGVAFASKWSLPDVGPQPYFNSGVMLIDLDRVRAERSFSRVMEFAVSRWDDLEYGDQCAMNHVFWGRWRRLDPAWNVQRFVERRAIAKAGWGRRNGPALVHFITSDKPWTPNVWHPWAWLYWVNLKRTPFACEVATRNRMDAFQRLRLRLRWWLRRPPNVQGV